MTLTDSQLSSWRQLKTQFDADRDWMTDFAELRKKRQTIRPQIAQLLASFLDGQVTIDDLRSEWDKKTRTVWNSFGLKGLSSAIFLNIIVKHVPDQEQATDELRQVIRVPKDDQDARSRMLAFEAYLEAEIKSGNVTRRLLSTLRIPFFVSAFWHMQNPELWPMFYVSAREVFQRHDLYTPKNAVVHDYFAFRDVYRSLMLGLDITAWDVEQLCWFDIKKNKPPTPIKPEIEEETDDEEQPPDDTPITSPYSHTHAQFLLASIGKAFKLKIWIASNDHHKQWNGQRFRDLSIPELPALGIGSEEAEKIVRRIDVLWMRGSNQVVAAFEIEHSTSIYSGLLRMADLMVLSPNISFPLYIVAPEHRLDKVRRQLFRPSLQMLGLNETCGFFSIESLAEHAEHIKKWAKDPEAIRQQLAEYVATVDEEAVEPL